MTWGRRTAKLGHMTNVANRRLGPHYYFRVDFEKRVSLNIPALAKNVVVVASGSIENVSITSLSKVYSDLTSEGYKVKNVYQKPLDALTGSPSQGSPSLRDGRDDAPSLDGGFAAREVLYGYYNFEGDILVVDPDNYENTIGYVLCFQATEDDDIGEFTEWSSGPFLPLSLTSVERSRPVYVNEHAAR